MRIAIEGCAHGELEIIYDVIVEAQKVDGQKIDLLICCGDFQSTRNLKDLQCMAVPDKFKDIGSFYKYYSGEKVAPVLTIFIGGNHEASNYLQEFPYGGWVAPNIYYMGYASVINVGGIRIAGMSGIYKGQDYLRGHYESSPYTSSSMRSVYHLRNLEVYRLKQISGHVDIFFSHDWPAGITQFGDVQNLLMKKPFFRNDIENNSLGSPPAMELLEQHYPSYWFAAHLHCMFAALVVDKEDKTRKTKFLSLDKCLPQRRFLQIIDIEHDDNKPIKISYDLEWLTILFLTNHLLSTKHTLCHMPGPLDTARWRFTPTKEEKERVLLRFDNDLTVPLNFSKTVEAYNPTQHNGNDQPNFVLNEQTIEFCDTLAIDDPLALIKLTMGRNDDDTRSNNSFTPNNSFNSSSNLGETPSKLSDNSQPNTPKTSINLEQKFIMEENNQFGFIIDNTPDRSLKSMMSPMKLPPVSANNSFTGEAEGEIEIKRQMSASKNNTKSPDTSSTEQNISPVDRNKKFRRRNQSIYSRTDE